MKYCKADVPEQVLDSFEHRNDNQIMNLEMYAILCSLETFSDACFGCNVVIWRDNVAGECALKRQSAKACDHNRLVHAVRSKAIDLRIGICFCRAPSEMNIADGPTRPKGDVGINVLEAANAVETCCQFVNLKM